MIAITMLLSTDDNMPFGKHKGKRIRDLSTQYKNWVANNIPLDKLKEKFDEKVINLFLDCKDWKYQPPSRGSSDGKTWQDRAKNDYRSSDSMRRINPNLWMECYKGNCSDSDWKDACRRVGY